MTQFSISFLAFYYYFSQDNKDRIVLIIKTLYKRYILPQRCCSSNSDMLFTDNQLFITGFPCL